MTRNSTKQLREDPDDPVTDSVAQRGMKKGHKNSNSTEKYPITRDELLTLLSDAVRFTAHRATTAKFRPRSGDKDRLAYMRVLAQLAGAAETVLKDAQNDDIEQRVLALEAMNEDHDTGRET